MIGEAVGGYYAGSLAIMTDAAHLLSDLAGFLISVFALWITSRPATATLSFGFHRAEIIGALLSVLLIWALTGVLVYEAVERVKKPTPINGKLMLIISTVGLIVNIAMAWVLHSSGHGHSHAGGGDHSHGGLFGGHGHGHGDGGHSHGHSHDGHSHDGHSHSRGSHPIQSNDELHIDEYKESDPSSPLLASRRKSSAANSNINVRAALIHVIGDMLQSIGVMIAAAVIWIKPEYNIVDPICTFVFSIIVLVTTVRLVAESFHVLMEGTPSGIDSSKVLKMLNAVESVNEVHDLHVWSIKTGKPALSVHLKIDFEADDQYVLNEIQQRVLTDFGICHVTIQIERTAGSNVLKIENINV